MSGLQSFVIMDEIMIVANVNRIDQVRDYDLNYLCTDTVFKIKPQYWKTM